MFYKAFLFSLLLFPLCCFSQEPYSINFNRADGLPTTNIYNSFQDKEGFMWFATDMGVLKYNGSHFTHFSTDDGLADNEVFGFFQDSKGRIWFVTYNGKIGYYYKNRFYNQTNDSRLNQPKNLGMILKISEDANGKINIIYYKGSMFTIDFNGKNSYFNFKGNTIYDQFHYAKSIYFLTQNGIVNTKDNHVVPLNADSNLSNVIFRTLYHKESFYFSFNNKVYVFRDNKINKIVELNIATNEIISLFIDTEDNLWLGTRNGVYKKSLPDQNAKILFYFKGKIISSIHEDFEKNKWITTLDNGIYFLPTNNTFIINGNSGEKLNITCLSKDKSNSLWAGTNNDDYYIIRNKSIKSFKLQSNVIPNNAISQIYHTKNSTFIIGNHAVQSIKKNKKTTIQFVGGRSFLEDSNGDYWFGASYLLKLNAKQFQNLTNVGFLSTNAMVKIKNRTTSLISHDDVIWAGTNNGIFSIENNKINPISEKISETKTAISDLYFQTSTNSLIVGSTSKGLFIFKDNQLIKHLSKKTGLTSNTVYSIKKGFTENTFFVCNNYGLDKIEYNGNQYTIQNMNSVFGLQKTKINDVEIVNDSLYVASDNGLFVIDAKNLKANFTKPKILLESINVNNKSYSFENKLVFNYDENDVKITFVGLSYNAQKSISYQYKLKGQETNWTKSSSPEINYKALSPGNYEFIIYSINSKNTYSNPAKISFKIKEPFWLTLPFILGGLLILIALLFTLWRKREKSINQKFELEKKNIQAERDRANVERQMIELEQKALRMQMNPHFIFNALNTIKGYYSEGNDEKAGDYISNFSSLLRKLLENTEQTIPLSTEIEMLQLYVDLTKIRYKNAFEYKIEVEKAINPNEVSIPTLLLQPMVENAIIHGLSPKKSNGLLIISFQKKSKFLVCIVTDNGIGRKAAAEKQKHRQHESKAIEITLERLSLIENETESKSTFNITDHYDENHNPSGTTVTIQIPYNYIW